MDFRGDMELCQKKGKDNTILRDYVLPDYTHVKRGYVKVMSAINPCKHSDFVVDKECSITYHCVNFCVLDIGISTAFILLFCSTVA